jgi:hypothetical protein
MGSKGVPASAGHFGDLPPVVAGHPALLQLDPDNRWLSRGPRFRMSAEVVRDQALFVAGLLSPKMYGPPVNPPQPAMGLSAAFGSGIDWQTSAGEDRYRRGLYTTPGAARIPILR